jgi:hypothetical protein
VRLSSPERAQWRRRRRLCAGHRWRPAAALPAAPLYGLWRGQSPLRRRLYAGRPALGFCGWRLLRRFAGFGAGNRGFNGGFARVDRFLLNHHALLTGFAGFGAGYRRFNGGFTRVASVLAVCAFSA